MSNLSDSTKALPGGDLGSIIIIIIIIIAVYLSNDASQYNKRLTGLNKESWLGASCLLLLFIFFHGVWYLLVQWACQVGNC